jgi:hypothetical protein
MSSLHHDPDEIVMVRGGAAAGVPMTLDEVRARLAAEDQPPPRLTLPRLSMDLLVAVASIGVLGLAIAALLFMPR